MIRCTAQPRQATPARLLRPQAILNLRPSRCSRGQASGPEAYGGRATPDARRVAGSGRASDTHLDRAEAKATALVAVMEGGVRLSPRSRSCEGAEGQDGDDRRSPCSPYAGKAIARLLVNLRNPQWLNAERARAWCRLLAAVTWTVIVAYLVTSRYGVDYFGEPVGTDFVSFWTASRLSLMGHPNSAYDPIIHQAAQRALFPTVVSGYFAFLYPPTFLFLCLPFALLPYSVALAAWLATGFIALCACLRRILPQRWAMLPVFVFPGILVNGGHGQNGFVTAACLGWSMVLSSHRPFLASRCIPGPPGYQAAFTSRSACSSACCPTLDCSRGRHDFRSWCRRSFLDRPR